MLSFMLLILAGTLLLNLPIASNDMNSIGFLNAFFSATSASCVTGLTVVNTQAHWSIFGKIVLLVLVQLGALGFITIFTVSLIALKKHISLKNRLLIQATFNQDSTGGMVHLVKYVVFVTFINEIIGAILLFAVFYTSSPIPVSEAVFQGIFHSISAFCNAGFDNIGETGLIPYQLNPWMNGIVMALIVSGGLGFIVWEEIAQIIMNRKQRNIRLGMQHLSLHSKIVFSITGILILLGTIFFLCTEWSNEATIGPLPFMYKVQAALFQSVTLRTAGYNTIDQGSLREISLFFSCILMFMGGSPASAAGGIKTVTVGIIIFSVISTLRGRSRIEAFGRTLPLDLLQKAMTVVCTILFMAFASSFILYFTERGGEIPPPYMDILFECFSASATVGISTGLTHHLSSLGKLVIIVCMFLGRISPVTLVVALSMKMNMNPYTIKYPEERVIIG
jgi:trk system potassium uptake protein TrkH